MKDNFFKPGKQAKPLKIVPKDTGKLVKAGVNLAIGLAFLGAVTKIIKN